MTRQQAITDLLTSIALEQAALSHILNAEGEKVQKILSFQQLTAETVLQTNRSVELILADKIALFRDCICSQEE